MIELVFDGTPKAVQSFRFTKQGRKYQPAEVVSWKNWIRLEAKRQLEKEAGFEIYRGAVAIDVSFIFPPLKNWSKKKLRMLEAGEVIYKTTRPDFDNLLKGATDALTDIIWKDDAQIVKVIVVKKYGLHARTELKVFSIEEGDSYVR